MHSVYRQRLNRFRKKQGILSDRALVAYIKALNLPSVARAANVPEECLTELLTQHAKSFHTVCNFTPELLGTGFDLDAKPTLKASIDALNLTQPAEFPNSFELDCPRITEEDNQGKIGSCVGWAGKNGAEVAIGAAKGDPAFRANPSWCYGRIKERTGERTHGATLEDLADVLKLDGVAAWDAMPVHREAPEGNPGNLPLSPSAYDDAAKRKIQDLYWIDEWDADTLKAILYGAYAKAPQRRLAIIISTPLHASFFNPETAVTGIVPMPLGDPENDPVKGGHAMTIVGWEHIDGQLYFIVKNHWGKEHGKDGYLLYPYAFVRKYFRRGIVCHTLVGEHFAKRSAKKRDPKMRTARPGAFAWGITGAVVAIFMLALLTGMITHAGSKANQIESTPTLESAMKAATTAPKQSETPLSPPAQTITPSDSDRSAIEIYRQIVRRIEKTQ